MSSSKQFSEVLHEWIEVFMRRSMTDFKRFMSESGLSFTHVNILMRLHHRGMVGVSEMGDHLGVTNPAVSQAIDRLVKDGLLVRTEDPGDRRAKQLTLTEKGHALIEKGIQARSQWIADFAESISPEQQTLVISALKLLTEGARKTDD